LLTFTLLINATTLFSQVFSNKEVGEKNKGLIDNLKTTEYPYSLPIWGAKVTQAGYNLPLPAGLSLQYFGSSADLVIDNLMVGFNDGPMYNLDGIVRFDKARATASAVTLRPDFWLFPFLSIYGIFGQSKASTDIGFGVWVPDSTGTSNEVFSAGTLVEFSTTTFGFGFTPTIGVAGGFLALDMNVAWTDVPQLAQPARTFVFGPRFGKSFKLKKENSNIAVWVGGFRVNLASGTEGSLDLSEVFPEGGGETGAKIDQGIEKVENAQQQVDSWWNGLSDLEQNSPVNKARYESVNAVLDQAGEILNAADAAINNISTSTVQYSMEKQMKDAWNFIVGSQYQVNKHLMLRVEVGFLGSRNQIMTGVQYRFGL
jgi:opacity protein-like surface antigen